MINVTKNSAVPWWAAFGAPLVGVPLLVILLALGAPKVTQGDTVNGATKAVTPTTEQVEPMTKTSVELPPEYKEDAAIPRC